MKKLLWPSADDPRFVEKITRKQRRPFERPPASLVRGLVVGCDIVDGYDCVTISPKQSKATGKILFIHGGAFVLPISNLHWRFVAGLARESGLSVTVPCYPFVPDNNYLDIHRHLRAVYETMLETAEPSEISVVGDSAGANLALVLPQLVGMDRHPGNVIALSPVVDLRVSNLLIDNLETSDPLLPLDAIRQLMPAYYRGTVATDPLVSPLFADYTNVKSNLYILNGGKDLLSPDINLLHEELLRQKVDHLYVFEKYLAHAWPIFPFRSSARIRARIAKWCLSTELSSAV